MKVQSTGKNNSGLITLEILIAFVVLILSISAVVLLEFGNQAVAVDSQISIEVLSKAQKILEEARVLSRQDFNSVNPYTTTEESGALTFTKTLNVQTVATNSTLDVWTKKITSIISWQNAGKSLSTTLTTFLTNKQASSVGTCSSILSGDWRNPQITSYEFGKDLVGDSVNIFPINSIDVNNNNLYVATNNTSNNTNPTFFKLSLTTPPTKPILISSIDNNPNVKPGFNAIKIVGNYAYAASAYGANYTTCTSSLSCSQLQVIDLTSMTMVAKFKIPGVTGSGGQAIGNTIFYKDGIIYLGLAKTASGPEFNMIDVGGGDAGGNPTNPVYMGGLNIGNGINAIYVKNNYAYIASPNNEELKVIKIKTNPYSPSQVGQFNALGGGGNNGNGKSLASIGDVLYFGRTLLTGNEFYILDTVDPNGDLPILGSGKNITNSGGSNTSVNNILVRNDLIFLLTNNDFQIFQKDDSYNLTPYATSIPTPSGSSSALDCEGNYIYFASNPTSNKGYLSTISPSS